MILDILVPNDSLQSEREYIIKVLVEDFLGLPYNILHSPEGLTPYIQINLGKKQINLSDAFFTLCRKQGWLSPATLPSNPLSTWFYPENFKNQFYSSLPVIYGTPEVETTERKISIGLDIFGSSFFMLSRYEEAIITNRDKLDRFPASASIAYKAGFLSRPIVNEYLELLWSCMKELWPELERKKKSFRMLVSCDVDDPFDFAYKSVLSTGKRLAADIIKRKSLPRAINTFRNFVAIKKSGKEQDPYFRNIFYLANFLEKNDLRGAFYFICGNTAGKIDGDYKITSDILIQSLIQELLIRGHEVGLHGSYNTYKSYEQLLLEYHTLTEVLKELNIKLSNIGGRQHYLRWQTPETAIIYEKVGLAYDTSLTYADYSGFRSGVCYEYPLYDIKGRRELKLMERPLIAMEGSIIQNKYMGLGDDKRALEYLISLKEQCRNYNGDFTLLWHNSFLNTSREYHLFEKTVLH